MPRKSIGKTAMTDAERQARYRAARAAGAPVIRIRRPADHRSRAKRWTSHVGNPAFEHTMVTSTAVFLLVNVVGVALALTGARSASTA